VGKRARGRAIIIGSGSLKGRPVVYPEGSSIRPTTARARESLFDSLAEQTVDAVFADLFAGAGAVGIEALSRGARFVHFVENGIDAVTNLRANLESLAIAPARYRIHAATVGTVLEQRPCPLADATVVFADPPYDAGVDALAELRPPELKNLQVLVIEHRSRVPVHAPHGMRLDRERRFGDTTLSYFVPASTAG
jgi:16S rRNA (guanine966-N2)-methyltransferase